MGVWYRMQEHRTAAFFGGDARQAYALRAFAQAGWAVRQFDVPAVPGVEQGEAFSSLRGALDGADVVLGPVPWKGSPPEELPALLAQRQVFFAGMVPQGLREELNRRGIPWYDLLEREDFAVLNAISTAEGAIAEAIAAGGGNLHLSCALVLGYGRCAKPLARKLQGLGAHVTVAARRWEAACAAISDGCEVLDFRMMPCHLPRFAYIFNTVPAMVLDESLLPGVSPDAVIIDIATTPGGVDFQAAEALGRTALLCQSLPGKYAPRATGECVAQTVRIILEEREEESPWGWNKCVPASD